jgi:hypothetical protein
MALLERQWAVAAPGQKREHPFQEIERAGVRRLDFLSRIDRGVAAVAARVHAWRKRAGTPLPIEEREPELSWRDVGDVARAAPRLLDWWLCWFAAKNI